MVAFLPSRRVSLVNLETGEGWFAMYNPTQFEEQVDVSWARHTVPGLSHQPLQYVNTNNYKFTLDLFYRSTAPNAGRLEEQSDSTLRTVFKQVGTVSGSTAQHEPSQPSSLEDVGQVRKFLMSLAYPIRATTVGGGGPPRVLVDWPNLLSMVCIVTNVGFTNTRFNKEAFPVDFVAKVAFEEIRGTRINSSEIRDLGSFRNED